MKSAIKATLFLGVLIFAVSGASVSPSLAEQQCSPQDLRDIKSFDRKAKKAQQKIRDVYNDTKRSRDPDVLEDSVEDMDDESEFFESAEYEAMKPVYERCGRQIPKMYSGFEPFWMPTN